ncbi:TIGR04076 family protein [Candidatus Bipolaricaulota bacterium]|jgi:uncharacterized repeat protein (TIGR04076 family)|nr:TIGR04076 family protein [Candidatus Bipolaricaulota bacterium]TFH10886.1 MAG: TIGR04076 family protein [Candidatus Atribacteria bacterium]
MPRIRITVVRRAVHKDLQDMHLDRDSFPQAYGPCEVMQEGDTFFVEGPYPARPDAFRCHDAWIDIQRSLAAVMYGGNLPWIKQAGTTVASCSDGMRPVSFKIERVSG